MAAQTRTLKITYGTLTLGAGQSDSNYTLTSFNHTESYTRATVSFEVAVNAATVAAFVTSETALITALSKIDQKLEVILDSNTRHTYDPDSSVNTGFNHRPTFQKVESEATSDRSALYSCSISCDLPADLSGRAGRLDSSVDVQETPSGRKTVTISGTYTALSNNDARAQFAAQINAYGATVMNSVVGAGLYELIADVSAEADDQDKILRFTRRYREIKHNQDAGTLDLTAVTDPSLVIQRSVPSTNAALDFPGLSGRVQPPNVLTAIYTAAVKFTETTDLNDLWTSTIRPYVLTEIQATVGDAVLAVTQEDWSFDQYENTIRATLNCISTGDSDWWQARVEWQESENKGIVLRPVWDGNPFARDRYQGIASHTLQIAYYTLGPVTGTETLTTHGQTHARHPEPPIIKNFEHVRTARKTTERSMGIAGGEVGVYVSTSRYFYVRAETPAGSAVGTTTRTRPGYQGV